MGTIENTTKAVARLKRIAAWLAQLNSLLENPARLREEHREREGEANARGLRDDILQGRMDRVDGELETVSLFLDQHKADPLISLTLDRVPPRRDVPWYLWHLSLANPYALRFDIPRFKTVYGLVFNLLRLFIDNREWHMLKGKSF